MARDRDRCRRSIDAIDGVDASRSIDRWFRSIAIDDVASRVCILAIAT